MQISKWIGIKDIILHRLCLDIMITLNLKLSLLFYIRSINLNKFSPN